MTMLPNYSGGCISNLGKGLFDSECDWVPEEIRDAKQIVLVLLDAFGFSVFERFSGGLDEMATFGVASMTSVLPSTTPMVLTSLTTGSAPGQHGLLGLIQRLDTGSVLNTISWEAEQGPAPDPWEYQHLEPFVGIDAVSISKREFANTGLTIAHQKRLRHDGWSTPASIVEYCEREMKSGVQLAYVYWSGIDEIGHEFGPDSSFFAREVFFADKLVGQIRDVTPADAQVVVIADHGVVGAGEQSNVSLESLEHLIQDYCGDARLRMLYSIPGRAEELVEKAKTTLSGFAEVLTREEAISKGVFGPFDPSFRSRVGDVNLLARGSYSFPSPTRPKEWKFKGLHGSNTPDELVVPLLYAPGRA